MIQVTLGYVTKYGKLIFDFPTISCFDLADEVTKLLQDTDFCLLVLLVMCLSRQIATNTTREVISEFHPNKLQRPRSGQLNDGISLELNHKSLTGHLNSRVSNKG